jgi:hypothetical protein
MNKTLISIEERKQIAVREIHTYPGCEDLSAVGIYPVTDEVVESNWSVQVVSGEGETPSHKPRCDLRQAQASSRIQSVDGLSLSCR